MNVQDAVKEYFKKRDRVVQKAVLTLSVSIGIVLFGLTLKKYSDYAHVFQRQHQLETDIQLLTKKLNKSLITAKNNAFLKKLSPLTKQMPDFSQDLTWLANCLSPDSVLTKILYHSGAYTIEGVSPRIEQFQLWTTALAKRQYAISIVKLHTESTGTHFTIQVVPVKPQAS